MSAIPAGGDRHVELTAGGAFEFDEAAGTKTSYPAEIIQREDGWLRTLRVKMARIGVGQIALAAPANPLRPLVDTVTERAQGGIASIEFVRWSSVQTIARIRACSTLHPPATLTLRASGGTVADQGVVQLDPVSTKACESFASEGTVLWTGRSASETFTLVAGDGSTQCELNIPQVITGADVYPDKPAPTWEPSGDKLAAAIALTVKARTDGCVDEKCPPLAGTTVAATSASGDVQVASVPDTDPLGRTIVVLTAGKPVETIALSIQVAGVFRSLVVVPGPPKPPTGIGGAGAGGAGSGGAGAGVGGAK